MQKIELNLDDLLNISRALGGYGSSGMKYTSDKIDILIDNERSRLAEADTCTLSLDPKILKRLDHLEYTVAKLKTNPAGFVSAEDGVHHNLSFVKAVYVSGHTKVFGVNEWSVRIVTYADEHKTVARYSGEQEAKAHAKLLARGTNHDTN